MWKILVVEDNHINSTLMLTMLNEHAECDVAVNGKEAFKIYNDTHEERKYDLYLVDLEMPVMDGVKLIKLIREYEGFMKVTEQNKLPIVIVTAHSDRVKEVEELGCYDVVLKPFEKDDLIEKIMHNIGHPQTE